MSKQYHFVTQWQVPASCEEVYSILNEPDNLPQWWPSVYLDVKTTASGNADDIGKKVSLYTKGWLPYTLRWNFVVIRTTRPSGFSFNAFGDFLGSGTWKFTQHNETCIVSFDWKLEVQKPLLRYFSFLLKPVFSANHLWAMRQGEKSLRLELLRRRCTSEQERKDLPLPPGPTFPHNLTRNKRLDS